MRNAAAMRSYAAIRPFPGEVECGDAAACWREDGFLLAAIVDGLGHGPEASLAARAYMSVVEAMRGAAPLARLLEADRVMRATRGAAGAVARIDLARRDLVFAGVGNIRAGVVGNCAKLLEGAPGIVGSGLKNPREVALNFAPGDLLALWTDGLARVDLGLWAKPDARRSAEEVARKMLAAFGRAIDDCAVLCVLLAPSEDGGPTP